MTTSDEDLARAASNGDRAAFAELVARSYDRVFALAFRLTGSRSDAEDLAQDICLALPGKLRGWRGEARFSTWLYRIVVNATHDRRRRQATHARAAEAWGDLEVANRADDVQKAEAEAWLTAAMRALPEDLRDTVALTVTGEMTHAEAAEVLGVSEGTVSWRMSEVRRRLREMASQGDTG